MLIFRNMFGSRKKVKNDRLLWRQDGRNCDKCFSMSYFTETVMMCIGTLFREEKYEYDSKLFNIVSVRDIQEIFHEVGAKKLMDECVERI